MSQRQRSLAQVVHGSFYIAKTGISITAWWLSSAVPQRHPINVGNLFDLPFLPVTQRMSRAVTMDEVHFWLVRALMGLLILHVGAVVRHHFYDYDDTLIRMAPFPRTGPSLSRRFASPLANWAMRLHGNAGVRRSRQFRARCCA